jgi:hypothetical protein
MKINIGLDNFFNDPVDSAHFTQHICATVLKYYIGLEKSKIRDNRGNDEVIVLARENLEHLIQSKNYIESYYITKKGKE